MVEKSAVKVLVVDDEPFMLTLLSHNMEVVAEGVEDRADWDFLCRTGCHLAQGYFIGRPMPAGDLAAWLLGTGLIGLIALGSKRESAERAHAAAA